MGVGVLMVSKESGGAATHAQAEAGQALAAPPTSEEKWDNTGLGKRMLFRKTLIISGYCVIMTSGSNLLF